MYIAKYIFLAVLIVPVFSVAKTGELKKAYVSVNETIEKTGEQAKVLRLLEREKKAIQSAIRKKNEGFSKEANKIKKEMSLLSEQEQMKKYESMQKMQVMMQQFIEQKKMEFQQKEAKVRADLIKKVKLVVNQVAKKEKVKVVYNKDEMLWVHPEMDLTSKVIRSYKKKYK